MPTKWLQERTNGSKKGLGIAFEGPGVDRPLCQPHTGLQRDLLNNLEVVIHRPYGMQYLRDIGGLLRIR